VFIFRFGRKRIVPWRFTALGFSAVTCNMALLIIGHCSIVAAHFICFNACYLFNAPDAIQEIELLFSLMKRNFGASTTRPAMENNSGSICERARCALPWKWRNWEERRINMPHGIARVRSVTRPMPENGDSCCSSCSSHYPIAY